MTKTDDAWEVKVVDNWPGTGEKLEKIESRIAFAKENPGWEADRWGRDIPAGAKSYTWTKMLLDADAIATKYDSKVLSGKLDHGLLDLPEGMSPEEVVTAFLLNFRVHVMSELEKTHGTATVKITPIDFWFTVPATWQEVAVATTREAAINAGFCSRKDDTLNFITEPEAAAIAILSYHTTKNPYLLRVR